MRSHGPLSQENATIKALVLERQHELSLRDIDLPLEVGPTDVRISIHTVV